jgi:hypothetical protein
MLETSSFSRAPIITIEGPDQNTIEFLTRRLAQHMKNPSNISTRYNENCSKIGYQVSQSKRGSVELPDLVHYTLRNANLWELQSELRVLSNTGITAIFNNYVLSNRAYLLSKGNASTEVCPQLDAGLPKPDLQVFVSSSSAALKLHPSALPWDSYQRRLALSNAFDCVAEIYPNLCIIDNKPNDILNAAEDLIVSYDKLKINQLKRIKCFDGYE